MEPKTTNREFLSQMTVLNKDFVRFLMKNLEEFPGADLTPTISSYLKHVDVLDKKFTNQEPKSTVPQVPEPSVDARESHSSQQSDEAAENNFHSNRKRPLPPSDELRTFGSSKQLKLAEPSKNDSSTAQSSSSASSFGLSNSTINGTQNTSSGQTLGSLFKVTDPKPTEDTQNKSDGSSNQVSFFSSLNKPKMPDFKQTTDSDLNKSDTSSISQPQLFGSLLKPKSSDSKPNDVAPMKSDGAFNQLPPFSSLFPSKSTTNSKQADEDLNKTDASSSSQNQLFGFSLFGQTKPEDPKPTGDFLNKSDGPSSQPSLFGSLFAPKTVDGDLNKSDTTSTQQPQLFGSLFGQPKPEDPKPATNGEHDENEEPPKVEIVEQKEEGALFCMKANIFVYKEKKWEKMGVGYVNVLPGDNNKRFLVRAANTLGSIWINTHIAEHFKAFLKGDKALTVRFPEKEKDDKITIVQYLMKGGDADEFKKLGEHLNANVLH
ncbi:hypothetical protein M3Y97_00645600 [Aphelenchoides bicaudatus]|nr:hypothetical protein M3Y97_00645600 [Aphelenchoides bicaudatus]